MRRYKDMIFNTLIKYNCKKIAMEEHSVSPTEMSFVWSVTADNMEDYVTNNSNCQNSYQLS